MNDFPTLSEMGIQNFDEIVSYNSRQVGEKRDLLTISYKRKKGSFLPHRKTYKFGRAIKGSPDAGEPSHFKEVYEISPFLQKAVKELDLIVEKHNSNLNNAERLLKRIDHLENELKDATSELKSIIKSM